MKYESIRKIDSRTKRNVSNFQNFLSIVSHVRKTFPRSIVRTTNFRISESHYILRQEDWIALCMDIQGIFPPPKLFSIRKKLHFYINFRSILQERSRPRINTPYRFSIKPSLKRAGQSNFDDGTTSPTTFFVQILAL